MTHKWNRRIEVIKKAEQEGTYYITPEPMPSRQTANANAGIIFIVAIVGLIAISGLILIWLF